MTAIYRILDTMTAYQMMQLAEDVCMAKYGHYNQFHQPRFEPYISKADKVMYMKAEDVPDVVLEKWKGYLRRTE